MQGLCELNIDEYDACLQDVEDHDFRRADLS
jgi:hypothetical protein